MKKAIDFYSGVRGYRASVVKVDTRAQDLHNHNWNGVLMFLNFNFYADRIRMWKVFNVGEGKFVHYYKLMKRGTSRGSTRLEVIEPLTSPPVTTGFLYKNSKSKEKKKVNLVNSVTLKQVVSSYSKRPQRCKTTRTLASTFLTPKRIPRMTVLSVNGLSHAPTYALRIFHPKRTLKD